MTAALDHVGSQLGITEARAALILSLLSICLWWSDTRPLEAKSPDTQSEEEVEKQLDAVSVNKVLLKALDVSHNKLLQRIEGTAFHGADGIPSINCLRRWLGGERVKDEVLRTARMKAVIKWIEDCVDLDEYNLHWDCYGTGEITRARATSV